MKKFCSIALVVATGLISACSYGSIATAGNAVVITRNDAFLFGALRKVFVCQVTPQGASACAANESP